MYSFEEIIGHLTNKVPEELTGHSKFLSVLAYIVAKQLKEDHPELKLDDLFADRIGNRCGNPDIPFRRTRNLRNAVFLLLGILVLDHDVAVTECPDGEQKKKDHQCRKKKNNSVFHRVSDSL